jgi:hypothetical protein
MKKKTNPPLLPTLINRFKRNCGTFRGGGGKNPLSSMTLGQFAQKQFKNIYFLFLKNNNDHGVGVNIIIII